MQHINGKLVFTSAAVYFPMRWFFMEKVGREMDGIHSPVPFYQEDLKRPVDNFMARGLKAGKPFQRSNWMVSDNPELNQVGICFTAVKMALDAACNVPHPPASIIPHINLAAALWGSSFARCPPQVLSNEQTCYCLQSPSRTGVPQHHRCLQ